jgi:DNA-binding transcriptional MerR regulator
MYNIRDLSKLLSRSVRQIRRYLEDGKLPTPQTGRYRRWEWTPQETQLILKRFKNEVWSTKDIQGFLGKEDEVGYKILERLVIRVCNNES